MLRHLDPSHLYNLVRFLGFVLVCFRAIEYHTQLTKDLGIVALPSTQSLDQFVYLSYEVQFLVKVLPESSLRLSSMSAVVPGSSLCSSGSICMSHISSGLASARSRIGGFCEYRPSNTPPYRHTSVHS